MTAARHSAAPLHPDTARAANEQIRRLRQALSDVRCQIETEPSVRFSDARILETINAALRGTR